MSLGYTLCMLFWLLLPQVQVCSLYHGLDSEGQVELGRVKTPQVSARSSLEHPAWCFVGIWVW